jgi:hypothetical protein
MEIDRDAEVEGNPSSRASHNMVEKQYRTRLNMQFTSLLDALPTEIVGAEFEGYVDSKGSSGKVSKGDVLVFAKRYIQTLEQEKKALEGEKIETERDLRRLKAAWVKNGGEPLV